MKRLLYILSVCTMMFSGSLSFADDNLENVTITDEDDEQCVQERAPLSLLDDTSFVNVRQFDIAGIMLGMSYDEVNNAVVNGAGLYTLRKKNGIIYNINKNWKYNLDYECRQNKIYTPDKLENCIKSLARNRGLLYISKIHLERKFTGETIDVYFTSNAKDNVVWKIVYNNDADVIEGADKKFEDQRKKKIMVFWQGVLDKYGTPNSETKSAWISSDSASDPMMQAYYGQLVLSDYGLRENDCADNQNAAQKHFLAKPYAF